MSLEKSNSYHTYHCKSTTSPTHYFTSIWSYSSTAKVIKLITTRPNQTKLELKQTYSKTKRCSKFIDFDSALDHLLCIFFGPYLNPNIYGLYPIRVMHSLVNFQFRFLIQQSLMISIMLIWWFIFLINYNVVDKHQNVSHFHNHRTNTFHILLTLQQITCHLFSPC